MRAPNVCLPGLGRYLHASRAGKQSHGRPVACCSLVRRVWMVILGEAMGTVYLRWACLRQRWRCRRRSSWARAGIGPSEKVAGRETCNTRGTAWAARQGCGGPYPAHGLSGVGRPRACGRVHRLCAPGYEEVHRRVRSAEFPFSARSAARGRWLRGWTSSGRRRECKASTTRSSGRDSGE